jgi:hypothetical protein
MPIRLFSGCAALLALSASAGVPVTGGPAAFAATPPLAWQQVQTLYIQCLVATDRIGERETLQDDLCRRIERAAAKSAPVPVQAIGFGEPAVIDPANATLLVHAAVQQVGRSRLLLFSIRPYRAGGVENDIFFGAQPRAVSLSDGADFSAALDAAIAAAVSETLPWQAAR